MTKLCFNFIFIDMDKPKYYKRYIEKSIQLKLHTSGAVLVTGPKFCGKTTTCSVFAKSIYRINTRNAIRRTKLDPRIALSGETPHLIDEWQKIPDLWNYVKEDLDIKYEFGKYLLTGSATPPDRLEIQHTGAGRIAPLKRRPMSLFESLDSSGKVSLESLFSHPDQDVFDPNQDFTLQDLSYLICRGGWPLSLAVTDRQSALEVTKNYCDSLFTFSESDNLKYRNRKTDTLRMVLKSYARNISTEASRKTRINDVKKNDERIRDVKTFKEYQSALKNLFILEDREAWCPEIRSKTAIRSSPTRHFVDPSIACCVLDISPQDLLSDRNSFGLFFEDRAVRDLRVYRNSIGGRIRHYRDNTGLECDAVIHLNDGRWAPIEIKLGGIDLTEYGATRLNRLKEKLATKSSLSAPSFRRILTGFGPLYRRKDGIYVVPINRLRA